MKGESVDISLDDKIAFLKRPQAYSDRSTRVEAIETHMSWVFLSDRFAYKLKKPVRRDFLDFSTVAARRADCLLEVELNRRLAAPIYLGTVALRLQSDGGLSLGGDGKTIDWLVHMRRLPAARMLDAAIDSHDLTSADVDGFSRLLTDFYRCAAPVAFTFEAYRLRFENDIRAQHAELAKAQYRLPTDQIERIATAQLSFLARCPQLLEARSTRVVDGHGDLRPEHICLTEPPVIIDCLEFKRELRLLDPADELAFLALECERLGAPEVGTQVFAHYEGASGDRPPSALIHFYKSFRASLRAQIAIWHTADHDVHDHYKWQRRAREYLGLAQRHIEFCLRTLTAN